jgi:hypothetical protein
MILPKWATTVTPFSKTLALIIFISFPIIGFVLGIKYQTMLNSYNEVTVPSVVTSIVTKTTNIPTPIPTYTPSPTGYSAELKAKVRSEFIGNCQTKGHYSVTECNCAADYLAKNYTESELAKIYIQYRTSSQVSAALDAASKVCLKK